MKNTINIAGKKCRLEFNWNALTEYCGLTGITDLSAIDNISHISASDMLIFIYCAVKEGERMEGREFSLQPLDLGALLRPADIGEAMIVYSLQSKGAVDENVPVEKTEESKPKKKSRWMRLLG